MKTISSVHSYRVPRLIGVILAMVLASQACQFADTGQASAASLEQIVFRLVNDYRTSEGLPALKWDSEVAVLARQHSLDMASGTVTFGHDGFPSRVSAISALFSVRAVSENVGMTAHYEDPAHTVVNAWAQSSSHQENMEGNYQLTGVGVARAAASDAWYITQIYVQLRP